MKIELEITEQEIRDALARKVRVAIADQTNQWSVDDYIVKKVKEHWQQAVEKMVEECLSQSDVIRGKIMAAIERRLNTQITRLMKAMKQ